MRVSGKSNFALKNLSAISKFLIPVLTAILFVAYLPNSYSSAQTGRQATISEVEIEENYKIVRISGTTAENVAGAMNAANHTAAVQNVSNFSPRTLGSLVAPTSVEVTIGGKITTQNGRGIPSARVVLTSSDGTTRYTKTNPFGFYRFNDVEIGLTYFINVDHKRFTFESRAISITEENMTINFTGQPIQ